MGCVMGSAIPVHATRRGGPYEAPLDREWDDLADRTEASPFHRPGWMRAWWEAFGHGEPVVLTVRRDSRLVALLPMVRRLGALQSPTNWHTPLFGPLCVDSDAAAALADRLRDERAPQVRLTFVDPADPGLLAWQAAAAAAGRRTMVRTLQRSPFVATDGDKQAYQASLGRSLRGDVRRRRRRLEETGRVAFEVVNGRRNLPSLLEEGFAIEGSGWKTERGTAINSRPETLRFYTEIARWAADRGWLRLTFIRVDGRPIAFQFGLEESGRYHLVKLGYDPAWQQFSPGKLVQHHMVERAFDLGLRSYEFLGAEAQYKMEWAQGVRERRSVQAFDRTPAGLAAYASYAYGRPLAKRLQMELHRRTGSEHPRRGPDSAGS
jgi:CelD/BcsL family acetyltransferase involved in cellulose biosynthesis